ncbi:hypothetical protein SIID45300_02037 [Candidatus Magnetaquicoccaceae bacterium FCR-1]|uniref:Uncharacterized protein n=1 Tax=Candidatus Magnetaquiglobus chichijimensis TaxID=3141448 RepID=A0ABQ0C9Y9_9PROT
MNVSSIMPSDISTVNQIRSIQAAQRVFHTVQNQSSQTRQIIQQQTYMPPNYLSTKAYVVSLSAQAMQLSASIQ